MFPRRVRAYTRLILQKIVPLWGLIFRIVFCYVVGVTVYLTNRQGPYDARFTMRGKQNVAGSIVLVYLTRDDISWIGGIEEGGSKNVLWSLKEVADSTDAYFWNPIIWRKALSELQKLGTKTIGITLFFGEDTVRGTTSSEQALFFQNPAFIWGTKSSSSGRLINSGLAMKSRSNSGTLALRPDHDGNIRHFLKDEDGFPHIAERIAESFLDPAQDLRSLLDSSKGNSINYMGGPDTFKSYLFSDLVRGLLHDVDFKNSTVIIGLMDVGGHQVQTPTGRLTVAETMANIIYNYKGNLWIQEIPIWLGLIFIGLVLTASLFITFSYPQPVAIAFLGLEAVAILVFSAAGFDHYALWIPVLAPGSAMLAAYFVIFSYRLSESEKLTWESEREIHYLTQVETLKNNFLSLISHDLKNPIAKIQGILDRLLNTSDELSSTVKDDLKRIQLTSEELRSYITSIINVTKAEARDFKIRREVCDLNTIIQDAIERLRPLAEQKGILIKTELEPLFSMELDQQLISEVVINLIENAIKYSHANSQILVSSQEIGDDVKVEVVDWGQGIAQSDLPKVFEKFYRGDAPFILKESGGGLGLFLVKYFIELHSGKVFMSSELGVGTKVGFLLPLESDKLEDMNAKTDRAHRG